MKTFFLCLLSSLLLLANVSALSEESQAATNVKSESSAVAEPVINTKATKVSSVAGTGAVLKMFLGLFAVLLLIFALAWLVRKAGQGGLLNNPHLKILASLPLGPRERLVVVAAGKQQLLIGVAPGRISTLHVFDEPLIDNSEAPVPSEFARKIQAVMQKSSLMQASKNTDVDKVPR